MNDKESRRKTGKGFEQAIHRRDASGHTRSDIDLDLDQDLGWNKHSPSQSEKVNTKQSIDSWPMIS